VYAHSPCVCACVTLSPCIPLYVPLSSLRFSSPPVCLLIFGSYSFLDSKDSNLLEYKLDSFSSVYRKLTGKDVVL
jgi:hypothetical protein